MKQFICRFGILITIATILAIAVDYVITTGLKKADLRKYSTWNDIYKGGLNADLLIIGASNAWSGFNTYMLDTLLDLNSYNLGIDGHGIDFQIIRYETYSRFNSKPKIVLINTLFGGTFTNASHPQYEREQFLPYIYDDVLISQVAEAKKLTWIDLYLPLVRYFGYREEFENGILSFFGKTDFFDGGMYKGYRGNEYPWNRGTALSKDKMLSVIIDEKAVAILDSFSKQLSTEGIQVVFVKSPVYVPFINKHSNIGITDSILSTIAQRYDIPILDYYSSPIGTDSMNFSDPGHLNKKGSELFTFELCHDLDSLGLLK